MVETIKIKHIKVELKFFRKSALVENPGNEHQVAQLDPAIHVVILLDVSDKLVIRRATGKMSKIFTMFVFIGK